MTHTGRAAASTEISIELRDVGKMYKLFDNRQAKVLDALGLSRLLPRRLASWQPYWALRGINLTVRRGERIGIIGRNGAGKSTLLKMICSNIAPTEGAITVNGKIQALLEMGTGFHPEFSGRENIRASLAYNGLTAAEIARCEEDIVDFAELEAFIDQPLKTYSAGMYARLAFSTATAIEPEILIVDEVLGAGDAYFAAKCGERMRRLTHDAGATVLFVSHDLGSVQAMCDRSIWIDRGRITMAGTTLDVSRAYYKQVQERENQRRLASAQGMRRDDAARQSNVHLFRFRVADGLDPRSINRVHRIVLEEGRRQVHEVDVGGPMDNDREQDLYVYTAAGFMNWSEPVRTPRGLAREFRNVAGRYHHAPFQLRMADPDWSALAIQVEADCAEPVFLDVFIGENYFTLAQLGMGVATTRISLEPIVAEVARHSAFGAKADQVRSNEIIAWSSHEVEDRPTVTEGERPRSALLPGVEASTESVIPVVVIEQSASTLQASPVAPVPGPPAPPVFSGHVATPFAVSSSSHPSHSIVTWKEPEARITTVEYLDANGRAVGGITFGEALTVRLHYSARKRIVEPVFSITFYLADGRHLIHANNRTASASLPVIEGEGALDFIFDPFPAGPCELVMSCSIFEYIDLATHAAMPPPYYDQHDRAYELKVWQALETSINPGLINAHYRVAHHTAVVAP